MPRQIAMDSPKPRRRRAAVAVAVEPERGFIMNILLQSPKDTLAAAAAVIVVIGIVGNALFMQAGRHPAPMFGATPVATTPIAAAVQAQIQAPLPRSRPADAELKPFDTKPVEGAPIAPAKTVALQTTNAPRPAASIPASRNDPVADLIVSTRRVAAIQRALTEYGYGQIKPTGVAGPDTQSAVQKFERDRKMPVTGQISDKLIRDLVVLTGHPIE